MPHLNCATCYQPVQINGRLGSELRKGQPYVVCTTCANRRGTLALELASDSAYVKVGELLASLSLEQVFAQLEQVAMQRALVHAEHGDNDAFRAHVDVAEALFTARALIQPYV